MTAVRVVFLGRLAKEDVTARLKEVPGIDVFVTEDFAEMLKVLRGAEVLVTPDIRGDEGKLLTEALRAKDRSVRWITQIEVDSIVLTSDTNVHTGASYPAPGLRRVPSPPSPTRRERGVRVLSVL